VRVVVDCRVFDRPGVLARRFGSDPDVVEWVDLCHRLREIVLRRAPHDLETLVGIGDHPHLRWQRAVAEIRRAERKALREVDAIFRAIAVAIEALKVSGTRGSDVWVSSADVDEAVLRVADRTYAA
jgi:hypothetical protein